MQGLDALGLATLDSITSTAAANIPFSAFFTYPLMTDEDMNNLRTFQRLVVLMLGSTSGEDSNTVRFTAHLVENYVDV